MRQLVELTKQALRSKIIALLKSQKEEDRSRKSRSISKKLFRTRVFKKAKTVMMYIALRGEVDTKEMIREAIRLGKIVTVPMCVRSRAAMRPCILDYNAGLKKGPYGVLEPTVGKFVRHADLDLVVVPGLAFDKKGRRLGRGKGSYDRFLRKIPTDTPTIGVAYSRQLVSRVPTDAHDVCVHQVLVA